MRPSVHPPTLLNSSNRLPLAMHAVNYQSEPAGSLQMAPLSAGRGVRVQAAQSDPINWIVCPSERPQDNLITGLIKSSRRGAARAQPADRSAMEPASARQNYETVIVLIAVL